VERNLFCDFSVGLGLLRYGLRYHRRVATDRRLPRTVVIVGKGRGLRGEGSGSLGVGIGLHHLRVDHHLPVALVNISIIIGVGPTRNELYRSRFIAYVLRKAVIVTDGGSGLSQFVLGC
jgi:hypothetical protein